MSRYRNWNSIAVRSVRSAFAAALALCALATVRAEATPPDEAVLADFKRDPLSFVTDLRISEAIQCGQVFLQDRTFAPASRKSALTALASIYHATDRPREARLTFLELLASDPTADLDEIERLAPPVTKLFYTVRDSLLLSSGMTAPPDVRTVAFGDMENNSILKGKYDLDAFSRGLVQVMITDLRKSTPLKIVDRQRLAVLREEIGLNSNNELFSKEQAVKTGKLTGAQSFIFGQIMQVEEKKIRLDLRWVRTETSEVLLSEGIEAKIGSSEDLFNLERKVLIEMLAPKIEKLLAGEDPDAKQVKGNAKEYLDGKSRNFTDGTGYIDYLLKAGEALLLEDSGDTDAAAIAWNEAATIYPGDPMATARGSALSAWNQLEDAK
ncbi:MAG: hypothetical protein IT349_09325 [Candidatus Eisenbacteria bacterium]|nr:hypothetical protein [Candidatus Eisenbacteria bacterium]MCC7142287.1 hypothetical protein [Candidatus Eisenbacteria bacterium]